MTILHKALEEVRANSVMHTLPHKARTLGDIIDRTRRADAAPIESDPSGKSAHQPGAKLDAGKVRPALVLGGFARALWRVSEVGTYGATKYTDNGWMEVPNGEPRYDDAGMRHWLKEKMGQENDQDTQIEHAAHDAWNALARLDLLLRAKEKLA